MIFLTVAIFLLFLSGVDTSNPGMVSTTSFHENAVDFSPVNLHELLGVHSPVTTRFACSFLCHQDPQCRTFVFDSPTCRLYEGSIHTGQLITATSSNTSIVGEILYDDIDLSSSYNQSCDHCYPDRYLVCQNNRCQCPPHTYWNGQNKCLNQLFADSPSSCASDQWCRQDMNMSCVCNKCQCSSGTFWYNHTCTPQYTVGAPCNTSHQCRNDLQMVCSRINKTCVSMSPKKIGVINGSLPANFAWLNTTLDWSGSEWWRGFDNQNYNFWNSGNSFLPIYIYLTLDDEYLLTSFQLIVVGDTTHDPRVLDYYYDENATCLAESFTFPVAPANWYTFPITSFNYQQKPMITKNIMINITRWSTYQVWLCDLTFFGIPY